eukprot:COSAG03_NODE_1688_length_3648_cov_10.485489_3_plen_78_part_00
MVDNMELAFIAWNRYPGSATGDQSLPDEPGMHTGQEGSLSVSLSLCLSFSLSLSLHRLVLGQAGPSGSCAARLLSES